MNALSLTMLATLCGIAIHAVALRRLPSRWRLPALPGLLLMTFGLIWAGSALGGEPLAFTDAVVALIVTLSLGLAYAFLLIGVLYDSPTLALVKEIERHGSAGMPVTGFDDFVARHPFLRSRLGALVAAGELEESGGELRLTGKAVQFLTVGDAYLRLRGRASSATG